MCLSVCLWAQITRTPFHYTNTARTLPANCDAVNLRDRFFSFSTGKKLSYRKDIHHNPIIKYASRCLEVATCFVRQTISWSSNESRIKHQNIALKSTMTKQWNSLLPQWNYLHFTREFVYISHLRSVMPKSYKPEVCPKSTSDEFLSRVIENCRLFQYGGLFRFYQQPKRRDWTRHEHCYMLYMWWIHCRV